MHPRFYEFIERLSERPHQDRHHIAVAGALVLTALFVGGRFVFFPVTLATGTGNTSIAGISETFSNLKVDMENQAALIEAQMKTLPGGVSQKNEPTKPATVPLVPDNSGPIKAEGWQGAQGGYYEYPAATTTPGTQIQTVTY